MRKMILNCHGLRRLGFSYADHGVSELTAYQRDDKAATPIITESITPATVTRTLTASEISRRKASTFTTQAGNLNGDSTTRSLSS
jgi:hypothetical protein